MKKPTVSVLITTYNRPELTCKAIDSVLEQDYPADDREIIVVDDGSTDDTRRILEGRYADRIRYLHKQNGGITSACTFGFEAAQGSIIAQLDSDDYWYPNKLSTCIPLFEQASDVVAVFHDLDIYKTNVSGAQGTCWKSLNVVITEAPYDGLSSYLDGYPVPAWTSGSLWRRSALMKILPFPEGLWGFNDAYCARNILFYGKVCALKQSLGGYLIHTTNDYAGGNSHQSKTRLERAIKESGIMSEAFNQRCIKFDRIPGEKRILVQKMALAEKHISLTLIESRKLTALKWILANEIGMPKLAQAQCIFNLLLPFRLSVFIKNKIIGRFISLD